MFRFIARVISSLNRRMSHIIVLISAKKNSREAVKNRQGNNILILCYGNIYRSPLAEYLMKKNCSGGKYFIKSAGFHTNTDRECEPGYLKILNQSGHDLTNHRSKLINKSDILWADIIVIMDRYNWDLLNKMDRDCGKKTVWIGAFSNNNSVEIMDPYNKGQIFTNKVVAEIENCVIDICKVLSQPR